MNWYKYSGKREEILVKKPYVGEVAIPYIINPTRDELLRLLQEARWNEARAMMLGNDLYVWKADLSNHADMATALGMDWKTMHGKGGYGTEAMRFVLENDKILVNVSNRDQKTDFFRRNDFNEYNYDVDDTIDDGYPTHEWRDRRTASNWYAKELKGEMEELRLSIEAKKDEKYAAAEDMASKRGHYIDPKRWTPINTNWCLRCGQTIQVNNVFYESSAADITGAVLLNDCTGQLEGEQFGHFENPRSKVTFANTNEKVLYIMRGLPGSGKSTKAEQLGRGGVVLSTDDFFMVNGEYVWDERALGYAHSWNIRRAKEAIDKGISPIVIDNTNIKAEYARPYVEMAKGAGYEVEVAEPDTPWKFNVDELAARNTHRVPRDKIQNMVDSWEPDLTPESILGSK